MLNDADTGQVLKKIVDPRFVKLDQQIPYQVPTPQSPFLRLRLFAHVPELCRGCNLYLRRKSPALFSVISQIWKRACARA